MYVQISFKSTATGLLLLPNAILRLSSNGSRASDPGNFQLPSREQFLSEEI